MGVQTVLIRYGTTHFNEFVYISIRMQALLIQYGTKHVNQIPKPFNEPPRDFNVCANNSYST